MSDEAKEDDLTKAIATNKLSDSSDKAVALLKKVKLGLSDLGMFEKHKEWHEQQKNNTVLGQTLVATYCCILLMKNKAMQERTAKGKTLRNQFRDTLNIIENIPLPVKSSYKDKMYKMRDSLPA